MSAKMLPALVAGLLLGTTALTSAQPAPDVYGAPEMYPGMYMADPYAGTPFEGVAPYSSYAEPNPYSGTVYDGVAPY